MAVGKSMMIMICFMIAVVAMITMFSVAQHDKSTDEIYSNVSSSINGTSHMAQEVTTSGSGFMMAMILITAIMFFGAAIMIFRGKR